MQNQSPTHDDLIAGANIAAKLIAENPDLEIGVIDLVISQAYCASADPVQWEASARMLLALRAAEAEEAECRLVPRH